VHPGSRALDQQVELDRRLGAPGDRQPSLDLGLAGPRVGPGVRHTSPGERLRRSEFGRSIQLTGMAQIADVSTFLVTLWSMFPVKETLMTFLASRQGSTS
jgi:hypothetical protein